ncbi:MAG TPA: amidohydrolase family protein [Candidatus Binataceae bacterium]|nr:amidohydrolase family protein [Candidatus Binataceae bacterium]
MSQTISADSHICEPPDLFTSRVDTRYREQAPRLVRRKAGDDNWLFPDGSMLSLAGFASAGNWQGKTTSAMRFEDVPAGAWDPHARLKEMTIDGVSAEVVYPSYGMNLFRTVTDAGMQTACVCAYNDWVREFCSAAPGRLVGVGILPSLDLEAALAELRRLAKLGFTNVLIDGHPPIAHYYDDPVWEPLWTALQETGIYASFHLFAGTAPVFDGAPRLNAGERFLADYTIAPSLLERQFALMIFAGVLERYPGLRLLCVENDAGWAAHFLKRMDHVYLRKGPRYPKGIKSGLLPSDFFKRQISCIFQDDRPGILTLEITGSDCLMWGSDYPHNDSTWPQSQQVIAEMFREVPERDRVKITYSNAAKLYNLE